MPIRKFGARPSLRATSAALLLPELVPPVPPLAVVPPVAVVPPLAFVPPAPAVPLVPALPPLPLEPSPSSLPFSSLLHAVSVDKRSAIDAGRKKRRMFSLLSKDVRKP